MPRQKAIPLKIDSDYFVGVTPLWVPPDRPPIDPKYHPAVNSLAEWVGPQWPNNEKSGFFLMRTILLNSCDFWAGYDWGKDVERASERRQNDKQRAHLKAAAIKMKSSLDSAPFRVERVNWFRSLIWAIGVEIDPDFTNRSAIAAIDHGMEKLVDHIENASKLPFFFGPLEYRIVPKRLRNRHVAVALYLADLISIWRRDGLKEGGIDYPHKPRLTKELPWKAIAQFASPPSSDRDDFLHPNNVQMLVKNINSRVVRVTTHRRSLNHVA